MKLELKQIEHWICRYSGYDLYRVGLYSDGTLIDVITLSEWGWEAAGEEYQDIADAINHVLVINGFTELPNDELPHEWPV